MITIAVWQEIEEVNDPTFSYKFDTDHFYVNYILPRNFYLLV